ncbi:hypothetical protein [Bacillus cereus group sp. BfR-BA-01403]|uniref:hypothetical protein n=1 Tax=Bacillus cereus group sp. BfR-BA-01403 TaxID=2920336 RepID=UPI001F58DD0B|nr:hypothetical protein [Bacillus cereus group sp. BfR-BA-01403]
MFEKGLRKSAFVLSLLCALIGILHIFGFTYDIMEYRGGGTLDPDTDTSINKIVTRIIEGLGIVAFGITGLLVAEQRKNEETDVEFKRNLLNLLEQVQKDQTEQTTLNQESMDKLSKSIHTLQSQAGRKKNKK